MKIIVSGPSSSTIISYLNDHEIVDGAGDSALIDALLGDGTGATMVVFDGTDGLTDHQRRQCLMLHLLGLRRVLVAQDPKSNEANDTRAFLDGIGVTGWPLVALPSLAEALQGLPPEADLSGLPLRLSIETVNGRVVTGRVICGRPAVDDELIFSPSHLCARIVSVDRRDGAVSLTLDRIVAVEAGEIASHHADPPCETDVLRAKVLWLNAPSPGEKRSFRLRLNGLIISADLQEDKAGKQGYSDIIIRLPRLIALDEFDVLPPTGRCVLLENDGPNIAAVGVIGMAGYPDQRGLNDVKSTNVTVVEHRVTTETRTARNGHRGGVLWFTGLSGSGKSTLAIEVEQRLFSLGYQAYVLDGDNMRRGLNANLGFSPDDRAENIRRVGQVAALFADAGFLVISAFISPYLSDRTRARAATEDLGAGRFHEIHIHASLEECERRDPKGLYKRARSGEIADFTGISAPYEAPENPDMVINTVDCSIDECTSRIVDYIVTEFVTP